MIRVALDAMGGDRAPDAAVDGAIQAVEAGFADPGQILLTGDETVVSSALADRGKSELGFEIRHAPDALDDLDSPVEALRKRPQNSIAVGVAAVQAGECGAFVSAGNTGLVVATATLNLRCLEGIRRPGIAATIQGDGHPFTVIDVGANPQPKPQHLLHYAIMGSAYHRDMFGAERPRVGLMNIGSEDKKGNPLAIETLQLLRQTSANFDFLGNVEGSEIFAGACDVVVCDGFTGNVLLKVSEGVAEYLMRSVAKEMAAAELGEEKSQQVLAGLRRHADWSEYGGALLLGVEGLVTICHGRSGPSAIRNGIRVALQAVGADLNRDIVEAARAVAPAG